RLGLTAKAAADEITDIGSFLLGDCSEAGKQCVVCCTHQGCVSNHKNIGVAGQREICVDFHHSMGARPDLEPDRCRRCFNPGRPDDDPSLYPLPVHHDTTSVNMLDLAVDANFDTELGKGVPRVSPELR